MKKLIEKETTLCDFCGAETWGSTCNGCSKDICYDCMGKHAVEYNHGVYFAGSGDGLYCHECDTALTTSGDPKLQAYKAIKALRAEEKGWHEDFRIRAEKAEAHLKTFA